ncbi:bile acid:sodium symporter family protein [Nocardioides sp. zg-536]|uniref:Bile acid:sodium symporter family protein n=1 Tax=Nocardioides faecalis TaxID=2803858 RepID=A0A939BUL5_9ACTN|nr:bile acid:sodium symporter family protein [Nocardioides faecalis]MBM9458996.1 bile acid:sodium symporter family protein [Nocardioides faecalis]MBS4753902.1 bile acid:sodium symporter family protein [Nocardioides faecalis]QVI57264.1 bile acid:sodium symporter family protein [Nocardioides faecalis]
MSAPGLVADLATLVSSLVSSLVPGVVSAAEDIDEVAVNFAPSSLVLLNVVLGLIMLGIALDTSPDDFRAVARHPRSFAIAIAAQLLVLPIVTFGLTLVLPVTASMALGMLLVACCPPGNISQVLTHRAGGNVALSVSMTAVGNLLYIAAMPLSIAFWGSLHPDTDALLTDVDLDPLRMLLEIVLIIGVPFAVGLAVRARFGRFAAAVQPGVKWFSLLALLGFIVGALAGNWAVFVQFLGVILLVVALHDAVALAIGYLTARLGGLGVRERKAMTFEVGIRNAGLGLGIVMTFFDGLGGMAVVAGWWGVWDIIAGLVLASLWARHSRRRGGEAASSAPGAQPGTTAVGS